MDLFEDLTPQQRDWLTSKVSLTQRLRTFTQNKISHHLFYDDWGITDDDQEAWIRRMEWQYEDAVWMACTVIIPATSVTEKTQELTQIGKRAIGEVLFQDPTLTRTDFIFSDREEDGITRSSTFYYKNQPIFLIEKFFSEFLEKLA